MASSVLLSSVLNIKYIGGNSGMRKIMQDETAEKDRAGHAILTKCDMM